MFAIVVSFLALGGFAKQDEAICSFDYCLTEEGIQAQEDCAEGGGECNSNYQWYLDDDKNRDGSNSPCVGCPDGYTGEGCADEIEQGEKENGDCGDGYTCTAGYYCDDGKCAEDLCGDRVCSEGYYCPKDSGYCELDPCNDGVSLPCNDYGSCYFNYTEALRNNDKENDDDESKAGITCKCFDQREGDYCQWKQGNGPCDLCPSMSLCVFDEDGWKWEDENNENEEEKQEDQNAELPDWCLCLYGWGGDACDEDPCDEMDCGDEGTCVTGSADTGCAQCSCFNNTYGEGCATSCVQQCYSEDECPCDDSVCHYGLCVPDETCKYHSDCGGLTYLDESYWGGSYYCDYKGRCSRCDVCSKFKDSISGRCPDVCNTTTSGQDYQVSSGAFASDGLTGATEKTQIVLTAQVASALLAAGGALALMGVACVYTCCKSGVCDGRRKRSILQLGGPVSGYNTWTSES